MEILSRAVGRRKEAVAQVILTKGTGQFIINDMPAEQYLQNNINIISVKAPIYALNNNNNEFSTDTILSTLDFNIKVKGGGLSGQAEAIKLGLARAIILIINNNSIINNINNIRKVLKDKGYLTQDSRVKERRKYGLKKARKASQYHKR